LRIKNGISWGIHLICPSIALTKEPKLKSVVEKSANRKKGKGDSIESGWVAVLRKVCGKDTGVASSACGKKRS